jgi:hypothetical protein
LDEKLRQIRELEEEKKGLQQLSEIENQKIQQNHQATIQEKDQKIFALKKQFAAIGEEIASKQ